MSYDNLIVKDWRHPPINITFGLVYPNTHRIGGSSYSMRLLYFLLNSYDDIVCEQIYLPENVKYPAHAFFDPKTQIRSIENKNLPNDFDILGFSLQFENDLKNILWILENSSIPLTKKSRQEVSQKNGTLFPVIIAGGPVATSNPLPFSEFFDLFFIGDAESNLRLFLDKVNEYIETKITFENLLLNASKIEGIFVPSLNNTVKRAVQKDLDAAPVPDYQLIIRNGKKSIFEKSFFLEINRGCPFKCKFCISSFHNSPFRNRSYENIKSTIDDGIKASKFETISMIGSCVSAHPRFTDVCDYILDKGKRFTIPSIRIEHLNSEVISRLESDGIKTITLAPETGSEKLRFNLGKKISNEMIYSTIKEIYESKIRNIKLYFLIGLPNEQEEDIIETVEMIKTIDKFGFERGSLRININPLIPKLNTPYESEVLFFLKENVNILKSRYQMIENELKNIPSIKLKFQNVKRILNNARLQALISLGDSNISNLLINYYLEGANFGSLRKAEKANSFTIDEYFMKIANNYVPWRI